MSTPALATKLFAPTRRAQFVARLRDVALLDITLDAGPHRQGHIHLRNWLTRLAA